MTIYPRLIEDADKALRELVYQTRNGGWYVSFIEDAEIGEHVEPILRLLAALRTASQTAAADVSASFGVALPQSQEP